MSRMTWIIACLLPVIVLFGGIAQAQGIRPPYRGGVTKSLGMPPKYNWYAGVSFGGELSGENRIAAFGKFGLYKALGNPTTGAFGLMAEGYGGVLDEKSEGGLRGSLVSPFLRMGVGADYAFRAERLDFLFTFIIPVRRGGIFGHGTDIRLEWIPWRDQYLDIALTIPLWQPNAGKTRPHKDYIEYEKTKPEPLVYEEENPALEKVLANISYLARWINRLTTPFMDQNAWGREGALEKFTAEMKEVETFLASGHPLMPDGVTTEQLVRSYHREIDRAFSIAFSGRQIDAGQSTMEGRRIAEKAKEIFLDEVILPYNRSFGIRRKPDGTAGLAVNARGEFVRWVLTSVDPNARGDVRWRAVGYVFLELLKQIEDNRDYSRKQWGNSEVVWIPMQYALLPEQHDSQEEIDALIERAIDVKFTPGNRVWYLRNEQFQYEFYRMVQEAEDYHVLWIHDYRGLNGEGKPDAIGFEQTKGYLEALIRRIRDYDRTAKIPVYMIIIDEIYWQANKGRIWSELLEDPLDHKLKLGEKDFKWMEEEIAALQEELREAVAESELLQSLARQYGSDWLKNQVKVHINITNPADLTFRSSQVIPILGFPDAVIRDHRKISFYDISEEDPYRGMAIYTGMGIGEHYAGAAWEDRAIMAQGPAILDLKHAARELFLNQGFNDAEVPYPLRDFPRSRDYERNVEKNVRYVGGRTTRAMQMHNETGYGVKPVNVTKAILYTLMPAGSILKTPDSLWNASIWGSMLLGSALRGDRVLVIAPSLRSAPSSGFPQMSRAQELLERLLIAREILGDEIASVGGLFRVGIYDPEMGVGDVIARNRAIRKTWDDTPFLQELYDFDPSFFIAVDEIFAELKGLGFEEKYLTDGGHKEAPKLHMKAQFFASREAWEKLISRAEWADAFRVMARHGIEDLTTQDLPDLLKRADELEAVGDTLINGYIAQLTSEEKEKIVFYIAVGSHNMNYRSFMMDGEVMFLVSYFDALPGMLDFIGLTGLCKWPETREELNGLLPPYSGTKRKIGRFIKTGV